MVQQLPELEYVRELGSGEFGTVYLCRVRLTGDLRAVKHIALEEGEDAEEWRREAEALAACRNDHIVPIHHASVTDDGPVLVMEYLAGGDAEKRWLPRGGPVGDVVGSLLDATWGLQHLHNEGLLHRDLKPANLLFDDGGRTVIGDFGLAGRATQTASLAYTPHVPPEVRAGSPWSRAADIYALGVTGWRLLGAPPRPDGDQLDAAVRTGKWPDRDRWPPHVHSRLRTVLRAAMHPDPERRPSSAQDLRERLSKVVPTVSWTPAAEDMFEWHGTDGLATYTLRIAKTKHGWQVEALRALTAGPRRLGAPLGFANEGDARKAAATILGNMAMIGPAGFRA